MNFAVVKFGGKQHLVSEGSVFEINGNLGKTGEKVEIKEVLLQAVNSKISIGTPLVEKASVTAEVVSNGKGEKIRVAKFKSKVRYRKVMGFRPLITALKVLSIGDEKVSTDSGKQPAARKGRAAKPSSK
ncbi:50S ribosomal protein L21 [Patescibacteria group bacterium]|nr:50S ribosomal protein L21 [Patescibacteria group bacterium]